jgi:glycosyltransferase involved in cell wall biosynthesis
MAGFRLDEGGVVRAVLDLCGALAGRGHEVTLCTWDASDVPEPWLSGGSGTPKVEVLSLASSAFGRLTRAARTRARQVIARADVVHLHVPWDPVCLELARLARRAGTPYVVTLHGMLDDWCMGQKGLKKRLYLAAAGRRMLRRAAAVHCTAEAEARQSRKWCGGGTCEVVPLVFDLAPFRDLPGPDLVRREHPGVRADTPAVLYLGRLHPIKRVDLLIESMARLPDDVRGARLLIAGTGDDRYERRLRAVAGACGLSDRVEFLGFVADRMKVSLLEAADVVVLPSHHENWGFALVEALACGTPVVTTRAVNIWSDLDASGGAVIAEPSPESIGQAIAGLLGDPSRRDAMGSGGRAWVLDTLEPDRVMGRYEHLYRLVTRPG